MSMDTLLVSPFQDFIFLSFLSPDTVICDPSLILILYFFKYMVFSGQGRRWLIFESRCFQHKFVDNWIVEEINSTAKKKVRLFPEIYKLYYGFDFPTFHLCNCYWLKVVHTKNIWFSLIYFVYISLTWYRYRYGKKAR